MKFTLKIQNFSFAHQKKDNSVNNQICLLAKTWSKTVKYQHEYLEQDYWVQASANGYKL